MLEHLPRWLGHALAPLRAGTDRLAVAAIRPGECAVIDLSSAAFPDGGRIPDRFTADGAGVSPPLHWDALPDGTAALALLVEDADSPTLAPLVHAVVWDLDLDAHQLEEGAIGHGGDGQPGGEHPETGRNSYLRRGWLPPDPPPGHGEHHYVFQLFALSSVPDLERAPGRSALLDELGGRLLGVGILTGTYSRDEPAEIGPISDAAPA
jgi:Raf kinase inhibitor-like YbhB/YbcL family protein